MDRTEKAFSLFIDTKYEKASAPLLCCSGGSNMLTGFFTTKNKKNPSSVKKGKKEEKMQENRNKATFLGLRQFSAEPPFFKFASAFFRCLVRDKNLSE